MIICGEFFKLARATALYAYFRAHYHSFSPPSWIARFLCDKPPTSGNSKPLSRGVPSR
jgi:hypothetical protein